MRDGNNSSERGITRDDADDAAAAGEGAEVGNFGPGPLKTHHPGGSEEDGASFAAPSPAPPTSGEFSGVHTPLPCVIISDPGEDLDDEMAMIMVSRVPANAGMEAHAATTSGYQCSDTKSDAAHKSSISATCRASYSVISVTSERLKKIIFIGNGGVEGMKK